MSDEPPEISRQAAPVGPAHDVVAAFHTSFHFTQGNTLDWSLSVDDDVYAPVLKGLEFSSLPSGLHGVERDVVYFTKDGYDAVAVFWRRKTSGSKERRGYQMEAYGVLLERSPYPRPWTHVPSLKLVQDRAALESYFARHRTTTSNPSNSATPFDWETELLSSSGQHPLLHLPHLLRIIGPSFLTIFKYVLSRRRILIYTQAPVEAACLLVKACVDVAFPDVRGEFHAEIQRDDHRPLALGTVGLIDIERLKAESESGLGWVACTTDALFLERPALYDLIVDLTTSVAPLPHTNHSTLVSRPTLHVSRPQTSPNPPSKSPQVKLQRIRFTFSDLRLWSRIDTILRECADDHAGSSTKHAEASKENRWTDILLPWRMYGYEDMCLICASLWLKDDNSTGVRLEGDDDVLLREASPPAGSDAPQRKAPPSARRRQPTRRDSGSSTATRSSTTSSTDSVRLKRYLGHPPQVRMSLMLVDFLHAQSAFWLDNLQELLLTRLSSAKAESRTAVVLAPQHLTSLRLSSLSDVDSKFVEWLAQTRFKRDVSVKRSWRDLVAAMMGW